MPTIFRVFWFLTFKRQKQMTKSHEDSKGEIFKRRTDFDLNTSKCKTEKIKCIALTNFFLFLILNNIKNIFDQFWIFWHNLEHLDFWPSRAKNKCQNPWRILKAKILGFLDFYVKVSNSKKWKMIYITFPKFFLGIPVSLKKILKWFWIHC